MNWPSFLFTSIIVFSSLLFLFLPPPLLHAQTSSATSQAILASYGNTSPTDLDLHSDDQINSLDFTSSWVLWADQTFVPGQIIVGWQQDSGITASDAQLLEREALIAQTGYAEITDGIAVGTLRPLGISLVSVPQGKESRAMELLQAIDGVSYVELDYIAQADQIYAPPTDPYYSNGDQWALDRMGWEEAWQFTQHSSNITIAVLDDGYHFNLNHPDKPTNITPGPRLDLTSDMCGHGTRVIGALAAPANGVGMVGACPWCKILAIDFAWEDNWSCYTTYSYMASGITYSANYGAKIINLSYSGKSASTAVQDAVNYATSKGSIVVSTSGNSSKYEPHTPCRYIDACIAATTPADNKASFSGWGDLGDVDFAAPGTNIITTNHYVSQWDYYRGTSFSAPLVAGAMGVLWSEHPTWTRAQVLSQTIRNSNLPSGESDPVKVGAGIPQIDKMIPHTWSSCETAWDPPWYTSSPHCPPMANVWGSSCDNPGQEWYCYFDGCPKGVANPCSGWVAPAGETPVWPCTCQ